MCFCRSEPHDNPVVAERCTCVVARKGVVIPAWTVSTFNASPASRKWTGSTLSFCFFPTERLVDGLGVKYFRRACNTPRWQTILFKWVGLWWFKKFQDFQLANLWCGLNKQMYEDGCCIQPTIVLGFRITWCFMHWAERLDTTPSSQSVVGLGMSSCRRISLPSPPHLLSTLGLEVVRVKALQFGLGLEAVTTCQISVLQKSNKWC